MAYEDSLAFILRPDVEGGYVNDPADKGSATNHGVTQAVYDAYRAEKNLPKQDVKLISNSEVSDIYLTEYWNPSHAGSAQHPLDTVIFDCSVNSGVGRAIKTLQQALGLVVDGSFGPNTLKAVQGCDAHAIAEKFLDIRSKFYDAIGVANPSQMKFEKGWHNRINKLNAAEGL
jgi:lysozyme family protein